MTEVKRLTNNKEIIAYLAEKFPLCFFIEGEAKPLKIDIFKDLVEVLSGNEIVSKTQLRQALRQYTSNWRYLHGCREGAERVDLYGNSCGILEQEHVEYAAKKLADAKAKFYEKKEASKKVKQKNSYKDTKKNKLHMEHSKKIVTKKSQFFPIDIEKLEKNTQVKVKVGYKMNIAKVLEVSKDNIRVELNNGLVITVTADRLFK